MHPLKHWYLTHAYCRLGINALFWVILVTALWSMDLLTKFDDKWRYGSGPDDFRLVAEQVTSAIGVLLMLIPLSWLSAFIFPQGVTQKNIALVIIASFAFALGHHSLMVIQRMLIYPLFDVDFVFSNFWWNVWFEYRKDVKVFIVSMILMIGYQYWMTKARKELNQVSEKIKVSTARGETWVQLKDINTIQSDRNYATVYTDDKEFLLRETLNNLERRLPSGQFLRVHRSHIVNVDHIVEVKRDNQGKQLLMLTNKMIVPVGRNFKDKLKNISQL